MFFIAQIIAWILIWPILLTEFLYDYITGDGTIADD